jgi:hypothetical protein
MKDLQAGLASGWLILVQYVNAASFSSAESN